MVKTKKKGLNVVKPQCLVPSSWGLCFFLHQNISLVQESKANPAVVLHMVTWVPSPTAVRVTHVIHTLTRTHTRAAHKRAVVTSPPHTHTHQTHCCHMRATLCVHGRTCKRSQGTDRVRWQSLFEYANARTSGTRVNRGHCAMS